MSFFRTRAVSVVCLARSTGVFVALVSAQLGCGAEPMQSSDGSVLDARSTQSDGAGRADTTIAPPDVGAVDSGFEPTLDADIDDVTSLPDVPTTMVDSGPDARDVVTPPDGPATRMLAFDGAEGFGAYSEGGRGGTVYTVTNLNDSGDGSFRWAVERAGRRIVQFNVHGVIQLRSPIDIRDPYITIDGRGALDPGESGITLRDHTLNIATRHVIVRYIRVRLGDYAVARRVITGRLRRPGNSDDLDCINVNNSEDVIFDHVSASWSADEIFSITNSRNVTVQWSIIAEPLGGIRDGIYIHPYGDNHQYCANNSAATLTYHHNLFAHYRFRGPQFEPNDAASWRSPNNPSFEAVNNVMYAYTDSGARFRYGFELASDRNTRAQYYFHFVGNRFLDSTGNESEINAAIDVGIEPNIRAYFLNNIGPHRSAADAQTALVFTGNNAANPIRSNATAMRQVSSAPLFTSAVPVTVQSADAARDAVFASAGCNIGRDVVDTRVVADARANRPATLRITQEGLPGGWPSYH